MYDYQNQIIDTNKGDIHHIFYNNKLKEKKMLVIQDQPVLASSTTVSVGSKSQEDSCCERILHFVKNIFLYFKTLFLSSIQYFRTKIVSSTKDGLKTESTRLSDLQIKAAHNSFDKGPLTEQMRITPSKPWIGSCRALEFDLVQNPATSTPEVSWQFVLQHGDPYKPESRSLEDALKEVKGWAKTNPDHEVCFIHLDMKDTCVSGDHVIFAQQIDRIIREYLTPEQLFTPEDCRQNKPSLRKAIEVNGWPTTDSLRGKFIFVMTGDDRDDLVAERRTVYCQSNKQSQVAFVDVDQRKLSDISKIITKYSDRMFLNIKQGSNQWRQLVQKARQNQMIARIWKANTKEKWKEAVTSGAHLIATDVISDKSKSWAFIPAPIQI